MLLVSGYTRPPLSSTTSQSPPPPPKLPPPPHAGRLPPPHRFLALLCCCCWTVEGCAGFVYSVKCCFSCASVKKEGTYRGDICCTSCIIYIYIHIFYCCYSVHDRSRCVRVAAYICACVRSNSVLTYFPFQQVNVDEQAPPPTPLAATTTTTT